MNDGVPAAAVRAGLVARRQQASPTRSCAARRWTRTRSSSTSTTDEVTGFLTGNGADDETPTWSPDGTQVIWTRDLDGRRQATCSSGRPTAAGSSSAITNVADGRGYATPAWQPAPKPAKPRPRCLAPPAGRWRRHTPARRRAETDTRPDPGVARRARRLPRARPAAPSRASGRSSAWASPSPRAASASRRARVKLDGVGEAGPQAQAEEDDAGCRKGPLRRRQEGDRAAQARREGPAGAFTSGARRSTAAAEDDPDHRAGRRRQDAARQAGRS